MAKVTKRFEVALDLSDAGANREFTVVEGDNGNEIAVFLSDGGIPVDLSGCRVIAVFCKSDGISTQDSGIEGGGVTIAGALNNEVVILLAPSSTAPGVVECELQIFSDDSRSTLVTTARFNFLCRRAILDDEAVAATPQYPLLVQLMLRVEALEAASAAAAKAANDAAARCEEAAEGVVTTWEINRYSTEEEA